jgi:hypothetical protein
MLASPNFVFRAEDEPGQIPNPKSQNPNPKTVAGVFPVSDHALASRLSFFLWSSIPDDELLRVAASGKLDDPAVLEQQTRRMLADKKADALIDNLAGQWLMLRQLDDVAPSTKEFDGGLRYSMHRETELMFETIVR